jgi:hypothetical protein
MAVPRGAPVHEEAVDRSQVVIARGARHRPPFRERLLGHEDFFRRYPERTRRGASRLGLRGGAVVGDEGLRHRLVEGRHEPERRCQDRAFLEAKEIFRGGVQAVRVIDAKSPDLALADQAERELVAGGEDLGALHPDGGQMIDVEETAPAGTFDRQAGRPGGRSWPRRRVFR